MCLTCSLREHGRAAAGVGQLVEAGDPRARERELGRDEEAVEQHQAECRGELDRVCQRPAEVFTRGNATASGRAQMWRRALGRRRVRAGERLLALLLEQLFLLLVGRLPGRVVGGHRGLRLADASPAELSSDGRRGGPCGPRDEDRPALSRPAPKASARRGFVYRIAYKNPSRNERRCSPCQRSSPGSEWRSRPACPSSRSGRVGTSTRSSDSSSTCWSTSSCSPACASFVVNIPADDVNGTILPALGIELLVGNLFYFWLARRLAIKEGRTDVTRDALRPERAAHVHRDARDHAADLPATRTTRSRRGRPASPGRSSSA